MAKKKTKTAKKKSKASRKPPAAKSPQKAAKGHAKPTRRKAARKAPSPQKRTSAATKAPAAKSPKRDASPEPKPLGVLAAAARVLKEARKPMRCKEMIDVMLEKGYWTTNGKTPAATLSAAIQREIQTKGKEARFKKVDRGLFGLNVKC